MKKNAMLKIAAVLLVAVLLTTCAISSTFAKYTTGQKAIGSSTATVAKWGVKVESISGDMGLFKDTYKDGTTINATSDKLIVAPGTTGSLTLDNKITGTPEVRGQIQYMLKIEDTFGDYVPVKFYLGSGASKTELTLATYNGKDFANVGDPIPFDAGDDLSTTDTITITWEWPFDGDDVKDTELGDASTLGTITVRVNVVVEQLGKDFAE